MRKFNVAEEKQKGIVGKVLSVWIEGVGGGYWRLAGWQGGIACIYTGGWGGQGPNG